MIQVYDFGGLGTHKKVGVDEVVLDALKHGIDTIAIISSGNYSDAILASIKEYGIEDRLKVVSLVNRLSCPSGIELFIEDKTILKSPQQRELYVLARVHGTLRIRDYTDFIPSALKAEADKILESNPDYVSLGIGSGKLFAVLYRAVKKRGSSTRIVGVLPKGRNPIFAEGNFDFSSLADKLTAPYTSFREEILQAQSEGHLLIEASNKEFVTANKEAKKRGYNSEISGSAGFILYDKAVRFRHGVGADSNIVIINTGCGRQKVVRAQPYLRLLKQAACATAIVFFLTGQPDITYDRYEMERNVLVDVAGCAADILGEKIDSHKLSNAGLQEYIEESKKRIGGPHHYWL